MTQDEIIENLTKLLDLRTKSEEVLINMIETAVLAEREACAKVCNTVVKMMDGTVFPETCAAAIRARGEK